MLSKPKLASSVRQQRGGVDVESEQVADGVAVFGAIQAMQGRAAGVGLGGGGAVERGFQRWR